MKSAKNSLKDFAPGEEIWGWRGEWEPDYVGGFRVYFSRCVRTGDGFDEAVIQCPHKHKNSAKAEACVNEFIRLAVDRKNQLHE